MSKSLGGDYKKKYKGILWTRAGVWVIAFILNWRVALMVWFLLSIYDSFKEYADKKQQSPPPNKGAKI